MLLIVLAVVLTGCGPDATEPSPTGSTRAGVFELREVREVAPSGTPGFDSLEVTCIDTEGTGASGCLDPAAAAEQEVVLLDREATAKYRLAPAALTADDISSAEAIQGDPQAAPGWAVVIQLTAGGARTFEELTSGLVGKPIAIVSDGAVVSAPTVQEPITSGAVQVGNLTESQARALARRLGGTS